RKIRNQPAELGVDRLRKRAMPEARGCLDRGTDDDRRQPGWAAELTAVEEPLAGIAVELEHGQRQVQRPRIMQVGRMDRLVGERRDLPQCDARRVASWW